MVFVVFVFKNSISLSLGTKKHLEAQVSLGLAINWKELKILIILISKIVTPISCGSLHGRGWVSNYTKNRAFINGIIIPPTYLGFKF